MATRTHYKASTAGPKRPPRPLSRPTTASEGDPRFVPLAPPDFQPLKVPPSISPSSQVRSVLDPLGIYLFFSSPFPIRKGTKVQ